MSRFPKVLIINGEPFNGLSATGITLTNLFSGWPADNLAQIFTAGIDPDEALCRNNWKLANSDLLPMGMFKQSTGQWRTSSHGEVPTATRGEHQGEPRRETVLSPRREKLRISAATRKFVVVSLDLLPYHLSKDLKKWIEAFQPDVIYSLLGSIRIVRLVAAVSRTYSIPVVPHFMDDWMSTYSVPGKSIGSGLHKRILQNGVKQVLRRAPVGLGIGQSMAIEYARDFQLHFDAFMNPVAVPGQYQRRESGSPRESTVRFIYVGGLHLGRERGLLHVGQALQALRAEGVRGELHIYAPTVDSERARSLQDLDDVIRFCGTVSPQEIEGILQQADVAVHVESFDRMHVRYTRISVSTKIPQYFASGMPVLAYGPEDAASCQYIQEQGCGILVGNADAASLKEAIRTLITDADLRHRFGFQAWKTAMENHEMTRERERFRTIFETVSQSNAVSPQT